MKKLLKILIPASVLLLSVIVLTVKIHISGIANTSSLYDFSDAGYFLVCGIAFSIAAVYLISSKCGTARVFSSKLKGTFTVVLALILWVSSSIGSYFGLQRLIFSGVIGTYHSGSLDLSSYSENWEYNSKYNCYALKNIVYVSEPVDKVFEAMSIYVPASYMNADGTVNHNGEVNGYTADTAPIIYLNGVSGYAQAVASPDISKGAEYIKNGFVYVSVASRGRETTDSSGNYIGKAPAAIVDLKAGIRFLKYNDKMLAGSSNKIISAGTSAGGAMSALLGSTGNSRKYDTYLEEIGAIMNETDDVYASMCYCPITDLDHADMAYEWMFGKDNSALSDFNKAVSGKLSSEYIDYLNSLKLTDPGTGTPLTMNSDGRSGTLYQYLMNHLDQSASKFLKSSDNASSYVSKYSSWLSYDGSEASINSLDDMIGSYLKRYKTVLSFDAWDLSQFENQEMGKSDINTSHFDTYIANVLTELKDQYPDEYSKYYQAYADVLNDSETQTQMYLLNPMNFIGSADVTTAPYFRIRLGTQDPHTSWMVALTLALKLQDNTKSNVDLAYVWDKPHGAVDYPDEFVQWVDSICK